MNLEKCISELTAKLQEGLKLPLENFNQLENIKSNGLYIVYRKNKVIYVGKTTRSGKIRLREMASDYRSHTLNRKLLKDHLQRKLDIQIEPLGNKSKAELIKNGKIKEIDFKKYQKEVNTTIKKNFRFRFIEETNNLTQLEHFAIAILNPQYND